MMLRSLVSLSLIYKSTRGVVCVCKYLKLRNISNIHIGLIFSPKTIHNCASTLNS